jgi:ABC-type glycerol-3-phosphate transport system permease component
MSQQLVTCLIAVAANLLGMMIIYAAMSYAVARRRTLAVVVLILISQLFWIVPALWIVQAGRDLQAGAYALWLGNLLVCGFSLVIFAKTASRIPASLGEIARMDGLGGFGIWRHTVLPFVRRDLIFMAVFTAMATLLPFWGCVVLPEAGNSILFYQRVLNPSGRLAFMAAMSIAGAIPLLGIHFAMKNGGTAAVPSQSL